MSFRNMKYIFLSYKPIQRKEQGSSLTLHFIIKTPSMNERASSFTSKGSITVEAAFVVCFFFLAAICLVNIMEVMSIQTSIKNALHAVGKEYAEESYLRPGIQTAEIERKIIQHIGEERLNRSLIANGSAGLDASESKRYWGTTIAEFKVKYQIKIPVALFRISMPWQEEMVRVKGWTGYEFHLPEWEGEKIVYVTDYGVVYHSDRKCTYLDLSVRTVDRTEIENLRSEGGSKYKACGLCSLWTVQSQVYITDYGERYHSSLDCSGLRRSVYAVPLSDVYGLGGCSKCVK